MYTAAFKDVDGRIVVSRHFETRRAGDKWCRWLSRQTCTVAVYFYRGGVGEELLEQYK